MKFEGESLKTCFDRTSSTGGIFDLDPFAKFLAQSKRKCKDSLQRLFTKESIRDSLTTAFIGTT